MDNPTGFQFTVLSAGELDRPFDGMAAGEFTDMWGRKTVIKAQDFPTWLENTKLAIDHTRTESGEVVGLPIDCFGHEEGDGAGWIVDAYLETVQKPGGKKLQVMRFLARWTETGRDLIGKNIRRMFSPTINTDDLVVLGGSLTNWPATRDKVGNVLLRPIELLSLSMRQGDRYETENGLDEGITGADDGDPVTDNKNGGTNMTDANMLTQLVGSDEFKGALAATIGEQVKAQLSAALQAMVPQGKPEAGAGGQIDILKLLDMEGATDETIAAFKGAMLGQYEQLQSRAKLEAAEMIAAIKREATVTDFVQLSVAGSPTSPRGLPVKADDLKKFCLGLNPEQFRFFQGMVADVLAGKVVEFAELGNSKKPQGTVKLPEYYADKIRKGELKLAQLSAPMFAADLGDMAQYDLTEFGGTK